MNKSYRIKTEVGTNADKHIKLKLEQEYDSFEILSLDINQKDIYQNFNCDYGVVVGRVIANGGVGIPNVKLSIFIPLTDEDSIRPEIKAIYPYESPRQKNSEGKRYNLLPRVAKTQLDGTIKPRQPFGTFPTKQELVTNESWLEVYDTYYKYSTITNNSGDYMLFGIPVGIQIVHMSVDITDIGRFSMTPQTLITNLGYSPKLFTDNGSKIKESSDLDDLPNIETQEISVDVIPFCGDSDIFDIGITRQDFRIRAQLLSTFTVFGTTLTPDRNGRWNNIDASSSSGDDLVDVYKFQGKVENILKYNTPDSFRVGKMNENFMYIPTNITDDRANIYDFDPQNDLVLLDKESYVRRFDNEGNFVFEIPCNRKKIITAEDGTDTEVSPDSVNGVFIEFRGMMLTEMTNDELDVNPDITQDNATFERIFRSKFRIPQAFHTNKYLSLDSSTVEDRNPVEYLGKHKIFKASEFYSITQFIATESRNAVINFKNDPEEYVDKITGNITLSNGSTNEDLSREMISNGLVRDNYKIFGGEWLNFTIFFHQWGTIQDEGSGSEQQYLTPLLFFTDTSQYRVKNFFDPLLNTEPIGAGLNNNQGYVRGDKILLDFIKIEKKDLLNIKNNTLNNGFRYNDLSLSSSIKKTNIFSGKASVSVENASRIFNGFNETSFIDTGFGFDNFEIPTNDTSNNPYFYMGVSKSNCIDFLFTLNII